MIITSGVVHGTYSSHFRRHDAAADAEQEDLFVDSVPHLFDICLQTGHDLTLGLRSTARHRRSRQIPELLAFRTSIHIIIIIIIIIIVKFQ